MLCKVPKVCHVGYVKAIIEARHDKKKYPDLDEQLKECASCDMENLLCAKCATKEIPSLNDVHSVHSNLSGLPNFEIFKFWRREHEALACPFSRHTKCVRDEEFDKNEVYYRYRLIDLAGFKALNDRLSHTVGDDMISSMAEVVSAFIAELRGYNHIAAIHRSGDEFYISEVMCPLLREREIKSRGIAEICEQFYHALKKQIFWFRLPRDNREKELEARETNHWLGVYENGDEHDFPFTLLSGVQIHGEDIAPQQDNDNRRGMFPEDCALFVGDVENMRGNWLPFNNYIFFVASFDSNLATENRNFDDYLAELKRKTELIVENMEPVEGADKRVHIARRQDLGILAVPVFWYELSKKASENSLGSFEKIYSHNSQSGAIYWKTVRREVAKKLAGETTYLPGLTLRSLIGKPLKEFLLN